jgi:hypothetical protein
MCRSIHTLFNFDPPVSEDELRNAALQYVRKISGMRTPSQTNTEAFDRAVEDVTAASRRLLEGLTTTAPPKDRDEERAKARARWERRAR